MEQWRAKAALAFNEVARLGNRKDRAMLRIMVPCRVLPVLEDVLVGGRENARLDRLLVWTDPTLRDEIRVLRRTKAGAWKRLGTIRLPAWPVG